MNDLAKSLSNEIERNRELLEAYRAIPTGQLGAAMINTDIKNAVKALASGDAIEMLKAFEAMKNNE